MSQFWKNISKKSDSENIKKDSSVLTDADVSPDVANSSTENILSQTTATDDGDTSILSTSFEEMDILSTSIPVVVDKNESITNEKSNSEITDSECSTPAQSKLEKENSFLNEEIYSLVKRKESGLFDDEMKSFLEKKEKMLNTSRLRLKQMKMIVESIFVA